MAQGIYIGGKEIQGVYIGSKQVLGVYAGSVQIWPTEQWSVVSVTVTKLREEVITIAEAIGGEAKTKVYFTVTENQRSDKGNTRTQEKDLDIEVTHTFSENTVESEQTYAATATYKDVLGTNHTISGTVKQEKLVWTFVRYFIDYGDSTATTYAAASGGMGYADVPVTVYSKYESNTNRTKDVEETTANVQLSHYFSATSAEDVQSAYVSATYSHPTYGTYTVYGYVYQLGKVAISIVDYDVDDIPASGGAVQSCVVYYLYNGTLKSQTVSFYVVSAAKIPAEERSRSFIDTRTVSVSEGGESASTNISVYQQANVGTEKVDRYEYGVPTLSLTGSITAGGGSLYASASATDTKYTYTEYTSGAKTATVGTNYTASVSISIDSNSSRFSRSGNTISHSSMLDSEGTDSVTVIATNDGDSSKKTSDTHSATNTRTEVEEGRTYGTPTISLNDSSLTAAGGYVTVSASVTNTVRYHSEYTSGYKSGSSERAYFGDVDLSISGSSRYTLSGTTVTHSSMGTTATTDSLTVTARNSDSYSKYATDSTSVTNRVESHGKQVIAAASTTYSSTISNWNVSLSYDTAPAKGGTLTPSLSWSCTETLTTTTIAETWYQTDIYTSGDEKVGTTQYGGEKSTSTSTDTLSTSNHANYDESRTFDGYSVNSSSGSVEVSSLGTTYKSAPYVYTSASVTISLSGKNGRGSGSGSDSVSVYQSANTYTESTSDSFYSMYLVDGGGSSPTVMPASACAVFAVCTKQTKTTRTYSSGAEEDMGSKASYMTDGVSISCGEDWLSTPTLPNGNYAYNSNVNGFVINASANQSSSNRIGHISVSALGSTHSASFTQGHN